jgi:hypothetical protein
MTDIAPLTRAEAIALGDCEQRIERGLKTFIEVGTALIAIRDNRLYRASHGTFELYCRERWNMTPQHANRLALAAGVVASMEPIGSTPPPSTESQARELAKVPEPERADVWAEAVERTAGKPTAAAVRQVAEERTAPDLKPRIVRQLTHAGQEGLTVADIAAAWPGAVSRADLWAALGELEEAGQVEPAGRARRGNHMEDLWALAELPTEDHPTQEGEGRSAGLPLAAATADESDASVVGDVAADELPDPLAGVGDQYRTDPAERIASVAEVAPEFVRPAEPDPVALVNAALDRFVPDQNAGTFAWRKDLHARLKPAHQVTLWIDVDDAAEFASADDVETIRQLALSFADLHRRILAARNDNVVQLRAVQ